MRHWTVSWKTNLGDEVGRVTGSSQYSLSLHGKVEWAWVDSLSYHIDNLDWFEPNHWSHSEQNLRITFSAHELLSIPFESFTIHSKNKDSVLWNFRIFLVSHNFEVEAHGINWDLLFSGIVLLGTSEETMDKEELVDVENLWD